MKVHDSGMPEESSWHCFYDIQTIVNWLPISKATESVVEIGCGYGTFTVPIVSNIKGKVYAFDIEEEMLDITKRNLSKLNLENVELIKRDVIEETTGLEAESVDLVLLFNILHSKDNRILLMEAEHILKYGGIVAIIHWRKDIKTPRGPSIESRPDEVQILEAISGLNLSPNGSTCILKPYHWGIQLIKEKDIRGRVYALNKMAELS